MGIRRILFLAVVGIAVALVARAHAAEISLTPPLKQEIANAKPLRAAPDDREMFDGRPLLVVFFASW